MPLVPKGEHVGQITRAEITFSFGRKLRLTLRLDSGAELLAHLNLGKQIPGPASEWYRAYARLMGRPPALGEKPDPAIFVGQRVRIRAITVMADKDGDPLPECLHYSRAKILGRAE